ncbi:MAG: TolC family protein [Planctomycetota bacterium]
MRNLKFMCLSLLLVFLFMGCGSEFSTEMHQERSHDTYEPPIESASKQAGIYMEKIANITEPNDVLTLKQALALILMHNPELKVFSLETRAAQARELQAGLRPNPEIEIEVENVGGTGELSGFDAAETTIQLSQLIELGNKSQKRKKVASFEKEISHLDYRRKRLEIFSEAAKAFVLVLRVQEELQLSNELLKLSEESFETVEKRVNAGKDSPVEKTRASVALSNMKILHRQAQRNLDFARKQLSFFWGQEKPLFKRATGDIYRVDSLPTLDDLMSQLKLNPEYVRWEAEIKKSQAILELERSKSAGDITIGAGVRRFDETNDNAFVFGVSIPLPVSDRNQGAKQEAVYNLAKSRAEQKTAWLKLQSEFSETHQKFANSYNQATSLENEVLPGAIEMFNVATRAYQEGKVDYLNVLDAQRTLFTTKDEYINALAEYHIRKTELERLVGQTLETIKSTEKRGADHEK